MKILVFPFPLLSHYLRCATLLHHKLLTAEIIFAGGCTAAKRVEALGFRTVPFEHFDSQFVLQCSRDFTFDWLDKTSLSRVLSQQVELIKKHSPDLVISDSAQTARIAAEISHVPHLALANAYMTPWYRGYRGVPPGHIAKRYESKAPPAIFRTIVRVAERLEMRKAYRPFRQIRLEAGLPFRKGYLDEYLGDWTAVVDDPGVFPLAHLPDNVRCTGPAYYEGVSQVTEPFSDSAKIIVTMGSSGIWPHIKLLEDPVFARFKISAVGDAAKMLSAPHIKSVDFAEPETLLQDARLVICHGGNGSIYQALNAGASVLCCPSMFEQEWNVAAFEQKQLVRRLPEKLDVAGLSKLIESSLASHVGRGLFSISDSRRKFVSFLNSIEADLLNGARKNHL